MQYPRIFILMKTSWLFFAIKGGMSIFHILRVFSMGHDFFWKLDSTFPSFTSNISVVLALFSLSIEYVVAETISYHKCDIYFSIRCRDHAHISDHLNRPRDDLNSSNLIGIVQTYSEFSFFFFFISSVHFFVYTFTRNRLGQFPSNFCQSSGPIISSSRNLFQGHGVIVTSSRRHFVKIRSLSYLNNE